MTLNSPADLRACSEDQLQQVCDETRGFLIDTVAKIGGHLAAGLGTVELTTALHYVFNTPDDRLVWDIGHQAYPHKILTGRRDQLHTIRQQGGLSGFLKRSESEYDTFGAGHSSTSISAALGMAVAAAQQKLDRDVIAVIGDGALTAGMAFEALNNAGDMDANVLVILNDNDMSISPNVGALKNYLTKLMTGPTVSSVRRSTKKALSSIPPVRDYARRWEEHIKGMILPSTLFEEMGFYYAGPIDGHDIDTLVTTLRNLKDIEGPRFLHIVTKKGKGFEPAEHAPIKYHGVSPFNPTTGEFGKKAKVRSYTDVFSDWLCDMAKLDEKLIGITPAMREGSGLVRFSEEYPERYFDVAIAEQHALTFAAGMACDGQKPVVAIYSTFLQRAYDQLIHDVSVQDLDVMLAIDRAGLVGADGATHAGVFDYSYLRCIPDCVIYAPSDEAECRDMLYSAYQHVGLTAVRYPRGAGIGAQERQDMQTIPLGTAQIVREGQHVAILSFGTLLPAVQLAAEKLNATVVNMRFVKPLDEALLHKLAAQYDLLVTVEENVIAGGAGSGVNEFLAANALATATLNLGLPDRYIDHGTQTAQLAQCGLDSEGIEASIKASPFFRPSHEKQQKTV
ncbi:1-deoxy-D-xylulose-5-phosphate synthase [Arenicella xantha]|uniref:1-deoxy-D-xylulose-5-phosphate synthase n=1 Tax=Arenicella xantha TaxID=644221 RepID=A0A395JF80_9GAMM|nr:1-deoxy-D-xylulose-5-phosphate synthase [Arenicella xantha]